jgi:hypothetical protein
VLAALATRAGADTPATSDAEILGRDRAWQVEDVELRTAYLSQRGHGFQS